MTGMGFVAPIVARHTLVIITLVVVVVVLGIGLVVIDESCLLRSLS